MTPHTETADSLPYFSVIIPTFNRADLISATVRSVLLQTFTGFEIIIVDDGSTDDTSEIVAAIADKRIRYLKKVNAERGAARNAGTRTATGRYITFLDSDDVFYPDHLLIAKNLLEKLTAPELLHLPYEVKNTDGTKTGNLPNLENNINQLLIRGNILSCSGVFLRQDVAKTNFFNEDRKLAGLEDWELWLRLACKYHFNHGTSVTSAIINHPGRSVLNAGEKSLTMRFDSLFHYVLSNPVIRAYYGKEVRTFESSCYTYIALHLALAKHHRVAAIKYLMKGIRKNYKCIFSRRFLAIFKHWI